MAPGSFFALYLHNDFVENNVVQIFYFANRYLLLAAMAGIAVALDSTTCVCFLCAVFLLDFLNRLLGNSTARPSTPSTSWQVMPLLVSRA
jgi:hypothetical protein